MKENNWPCTLKKTFLYQRLIQFRTLALRSDCIEQLLYATLQYLLNLKSNAIKQLCWDRCMFKDGKTITTHGKVMDTWLISSQAHLVGRRLDSNHGPLVAEATALPTEFQPLPNSKKKFGLTNRILAGNSHLAGSICPKYYLIDDWMSYPEKCVWLIWRWLSFWV